MDRILGEAKTLVIIICFPFVLLFVVNFIQFVRGAFRALKYFFKR